GRPPGRGRPCPRRRAAPAHPAPARAAPRIGRILPAARARAAVAPRPAAGSPMPARRPHAAPAHPRLRPHRAPAHPRIRACAGAPDRARSPVRPRPTVAPGPGSGVPVSTSLADPAQRRDPHPSDPEHRPRRASAAGPLTRLLLRMHFFAGILVGPFLLIAALSGAAYAIAPTAEQLVYRDMLSASSPAQLVPLADQVDTARDVHPDLQLSGVVPGTGG